MADEAQSIDNRRSWKTTWLGVSKYVFQALAALGFLLNVDIAPNGIVMIPDQGLPWYVYALCIAYAIAGIIQAVAQRDNNPTPVPGTRAGE